METCATFGTSPCPGHTAGIPGILFSNLINTLMASQCALGSPENYPENLSHRLDSTYDFIIIGSGSSGAVIANRLSEIEDWKILLLEAGGDPTLLSEVPAFIFSTLGSTIDWGYKAERQEGICEGMINKQCMWPRGKALGGSSSVNAMLYVRGHKRDFDNWADQGNKGWGYKDVLPYFIKSEDLRAEIKDKYSKIHGKGGLLTLEHFADTDPFKDVVVNAWKELGLRYLEGDRDMIGVVKTLGTLRQGTRCSTGKAFLSPIKERRNLHIAKFSHVTKILIDPETKTAFGVQFKTGNEIKEVKCSKEVILSAGAVNSPQLLMLSGIGPRDHLDQIGITPVIQNLKVGHNLQDHFINFGVLFSLNKSKPQAIPPSIVLDATYAILTGKKGPLSTIGLTDVLAFISTENDPSYPDIEMHHVHLPFNDSYIVPEFLRIAGFSPNIANTYLSLAFKSDVILVVPTLLRPKSRGKIELRSADPLDNPIILPKYLTEKEDFEKILKGTIYATKLVKTKLMKSLEAELEAIKFDNCEAEFGTKDYWECTIRNIGSTIYHPVGTCKMGPTTDSEAVVDPELKVIGVKALRVADASIMPTIISGNTNAAVIMIGEKVSDLIKTQWLQE